MKDQSMKRISLDDLADEKLPATTVEAINRVHLSVTAGRTRLNVQLDVPTKRAVSFLSSLTVLAWLLVTDSHQFMVALQQFWTTLLR